MGRIHYTSKSANTLVVSLEGDWTRDRDLPSAGEIRAEVDSFPLLTGISFNTETLREWDSYAAALLFALRDHCLKKNIPFNPDGLPEGLDKLITLAAAVPPPNGSSRTERTISPLENAGTRLLETVSSTKEILDFIGQAVMAFADLIRGRSPMRSSVFLAQLQACSSKALPIVSLISGLVGLILAFVGAIQLVMFGAQIYVASLVGISMIRVMGAVMTGVIMAGRTGAAYAAQLGTMEINEEIDALKTLGISPMAYLVLPRILALALAMPLLCLYADLMGIAGGMAVGVFMLDLNVMEYFNMTKSAITLNDFGIGLFQSFVFGIIVAVAGCLRGMQCQRNASAVGDAATSAVVTAIVAIVVATAVITLLCSILGI
ncbi:MAG TPA: ABC transporter permease [Desulfobacteraceae bacterium]|nr:ABC transporter permease [Desulfobacteraceae bacterium]